MQSCGLPGLRKQRKDLDTAKKTTRESQYVRKEKKERNRTKLACLGRQIIIHNFHGSAVGLIDLRIRTITGNLCSKFSELTQNGF